MAIVQLRPASPAPEAEPATFTCVVCGDELAPSLGRLGSIRCHDCRVTHLHVAHPETEVSGRRRWLRRREMTVKAA